MVIIRKGRYSVRMQDLLNILTSEQYHMSKLCFQRGLAFIYLVGFLILIDQGPGLLGSKGLLPIRLYVQRLNLRDAPSLFFWRADDAFLMSCAVLGLLISGLALLGFTERCGTAVSMLSWFLLWLLYLSFVNVGQTFYSFGWESMLLETGFLAIFLGGAEAAPPMIVIWLLRWVCFRNMLGSGLIKWRGDSCWRDLSCMSWYYETQPMPNPLSLYFHRLPQLMHKASVLWTLFIEIIVPFGLLSPWWPLCALAGALTVLFHGLIILSGNLSFLNYLSIVLCIPCFGDSILRRLLPFWKVETAAPAPTALIAMSYILGLYIAFRSIEPTRNLFSSQQVMNTRYDPLHLVNTYGAFGSVTRDRRELIILGTLDADPDRALWKPYEFRGKPGDVNRVPPIMSPYHWRLDWLMWFAAFDDYTRSPWTLNLVSKLLQAEPSVLRLLRSDPFQGEKPLWIKVDAHHYHFQDPGKTGWWKRDEAEEWLPPLNLDNPQFRHILEQRGWITAE